MSDKREPSEADTRAAKEFLDSINGDGGDPRREDETWADFLALAFQKHREEAVQYERSLGFVLGLNLGMWSSPGWDFIRSRTLLAETREEP